MSKFISLQEFLDEHENAPGERITIRYSRRVAYEVEVNIALVAKWYQERYKQPLDLSDEREVNCQAAAYSEGELQPEPDYFCDIDDDVERVEKEEEDSEEVVP